MDAVEQKAWRAWYSVLRTQADVILKEVEAKYLKRRSLERDLLLLRNNRFPKSRTAALRSTVCLMRLHDLLQRVGKQAAGHSIDQLHSALRLILGADDHSVQQQHLNSKESTIGEPSSHLAVATPDVSSTKDAMKQSESREKSETPYIILSMKKDMKVYIEVMALLICIFGWGIEREMTVLGPAIHLTLLPETKAYLSFLCEDCPNQFSRELSYTHDLLHYLRQPVLVMFPIPTISD